ncbi:hypothetical protein ESCO_005120 [Escovopsis weberi]|uniref:SWR1-complex protein 3 domain-containing protein n=1 Tax=Escovopsis weberi TaxID=150374 RepID=A0A0M9VVZ4_ESCWE|nr:hypothetical protein ESCO_005120 [Escovopsis weberi]
MEKKRKLPARASARVESANKRRTVTPRERSETPAPPPPPVVKEPTLPPHLPTSIQPGKPLPTVEDVQPDDLSAKDYQSISESGVLVESLARSRQKWLSDGLFEKFWTKPAKRKGVVTEDPNNPPKDCMTKVGMVTITFEPHIVEATMFAVKESRLRPPESQQQQQATKPLTQQTPVRPILQYGPPNGSMPPPSTPKPAAPVPNATNTTLKPSTGPASSDGPSRSSSQPPQQAPAPSAEAQRPQPSPAASNAVPTSSAGSGYSNARPSAPPLAAPQPTRPPSRPASDQHLLSEPPSRTPQPGQSHVSSTSAARLLVSAAPGQQPPAAGTPASSEGYPRNAPLAAAGPVSAPSPSPSPATGTKPAPNDPVIALLAQKASKDAALRDLMKRVAVGQAKDGELAHFQKIIDQLSAEYRKSGGQQGPSADRLLVDGRTVKYFADEVRAILDIVLASNPFQKSSDLRSPPGSDPLVVLLVKTALEDQRTKEMISRIADGSPGYTDSTDLKEILDRLHKDAKTVPQGIPTAPPARNPPANGVANGNPKAAQPVQTAPSAPQTSQQQQQQQQPIPQVLRSKGPPPAPKPDLAAVVFDFGSGDRFLFPKYSIVETVPTASGQEVIASFLIVRKGSISEYGGDPELDYYQPVTIRIAAANGRHLENLARVVAPQEEVRRYMDDVMDNMTRAEYVLLAMRLPRAPQNGDKEDGVPDEQKASSPTPRTESEAEQGLEVKPPSILWTARAVRSTKGTDPMEPQDAEAESEMHYRRLIQSVTAKE